MFGQSLLSAFGIACTTDTDQLFTSDVTATSLATYQLNNATTSIPSNTYPGTASNITYAAGKFGNAAVFNNNSLRSVVNVSIPLGSVKTISHWIKFNEFQADNIHIFSSSSNDLQLVLLNGSRNFAFYDGVSTKQFGSAFPNDFNWRHLVWVLNGTSTSLYLDGSFVSTITTASTTQTDIVIGSNTASNGVRGSIDQVRIFNTALPQAAVTALYNETTTTAASASIDYVSANPNSIAYYKMSDATDQLGNYNGTATNVNFNTEGKFGFAGAFNNGSGATSSYISLPSFMPTGNNPRSISMWIKTTSTSYQELFSYGSGGNNNFFIFRLPAGGTKLGIAFYANDHDFTATNITDGNWHHCAATYDGNLAKVYYDGVLIGTGTAGSISTNASNEKISGYQYTGSIDQIRLYDSAISAANVSTLYKEVECEPAAINALENFNTVLYTGNGSTQSISTVGFEPDLVWIKSRSNGRNHRLLDIIRGATKVLSSDDSSQEYTENSLTSFDSNGFTLGTGGNQNILNETYVAWNWKAPLANLSTSFNGNSYIDLGSTIDDPLRTAGEFGVSLWFNASSYGTNSVIFKLLNDIYVYIFLNASNQLECRVVNSSNVASTITTSVSLNTWYHVVWTGNSTNGVTLYLNGSSAGNTSWNGTFYTYPNTNYKFNYLGYNGSNTGWYNGSIDQLRVYSSALSSTEVTELYNETASDNSVLNYPAGAGCIATYPLQTDAVDLSGNYSGSSSNVTFGQPGYLTQNTNGTITSTVAANVDAGFSIVKWTGSNTTSTSVGHGLNQAPELVIMRTINTAGDWRAYVDGINDNQFLILNSSAAPTTLSGFNKNYTSTTISQQWASGNYNWIAYCFMSTPGYSKVGSYTGTNGAGNFIYTGFAPRFLLTKRATGASGGGWNIFDSARGTNKRLYPNLSNAEGTDSPAIVTFNSNGFTFNTADSWNNNSAYTYIYLAIA